MLQPFENILLGCMLLATKQGYKLIPTIGALNVSPIL